MRVITDELGSAYLHLEIVCPGCGKNMKFKILETAWTVSKDMAVAPIECPSCWFSGSLSLISKPEAA